MKQISSALQRIAPSATMAMTARVGQLKAAGKDIIGLSVGEPDFDTPEHVRDAAIRAMMEGQTRYTDVDGTPALKKAIAAKFRRENKLDYAPSQINVGAGGKQVIFHALVATLNPGEKVLIPAPYWVSYPDIVQFAGGTPVALPTTAAAGYKINPAQLDEAIGPNTRWLILNSPSNPTGAAYSAEELRALGEVLRKHPQVLVLTDDIYEQVWYAPFPFATLAEVCPDLIDRVLTVNGVSKSYAMTGWRIGYAAGPEWLIKAMATLQSQSSGNPCSISQAAAIAALEGPQDFLDERSHRFKARRDLVVAMLNDAPGLTCPTPDGAFYVYPDASQLIGLATPGGKRIETDQDLVEHLLDHGGVAVVHGGAFGGAPGFRVSYATSRDLLEQACERIQEACSALR